MFVQSTMTSLAGAAVALVILVDLATGQGPPIYNNYLQAQNYRTGAAPAPASPSRQALSSSSLYPQRVEYSADNKELEKAIELGKAGGESSKGLQGKKFDKELGLEAKKHEKDYEKSKGQDYESTAAPGMLSSLSSSMSDAWNRVSSLGRSTRSLTDANKDEGSKSSTKDEKRASTKDDTNGDGGSSNSNVPASSSRGIDSYEYLQQRQNGYIYFKVPKYLVCNY